MKQFKLLILLLVIGFVADAQINYLQMKSRYTWIAGKFDSTLHIPTGTTPSLRTGGHTGSGALFYKTSDSTVYVYTGTQWISVNGASDFIDSLRRVGGSTNVEARKNGVWTTQFVDSVGAGGGLTRLGPAGVWLVKTTDSTYAVDSAAPNAYYRALFPDSGTVWKRNGNGGINSTSDWFGTPDVTDISFKTANTERFRLLSNGGNKSDSIQFFATGEQNFTLRHRSIGLTFPVPTIIPTGENKNIAFDIMPRGNPGNYSTNGISWMDIVDTDCSTTNPPMAAARVGISTSSIHLGMRSFNGGAEKPVHLMMNTDSMTTWAVDRSITNNTGAFNITKSSASGGYTLLGLYNPTGGNTSSLFIIGQQLAQISGVSKFGFIRYNAAITPINVRDSNQLEIASNSGATGGMVFSTLAPDGALARPIKFGQTLASVTYEVARFDTLRNFIANYSVGIGVGLPDSALTVNSGVNFKRGVRLPNLPNGGSSADSVLVVTSDGSVKKRNTSDFGGGGGSGTVTSVGTGYGLSGGTITTTGTILVDSAYLSNYYLRRKDSLTASNLLGYVTRQVLADSMAALGTSYILNEITTGYDSLSYVEVDTLKLKGIRVVAGSFATVTPTITGTTVSYSVSGVDTTASFLTSVYRKTASDSVFYVKGGTHTFAFRDSIGGGAAGLQKGVTTIASSADRRILYDSSGILQDNGSLTYNAGGELLVGTTTDAGDYKAQIGGPIYSNAASGGYYMNGTVQRVQYDASAIYAFANSTFFVGTVAGYAGTFNGNKFYAGGSTTPHSTLQSGGSFAVPYAAKATSYTATGTDATLDLTATGQTITLPTAVGITGRKYTVKLTASGTGTVATTSAQTIDGAATYSLSSQYRYVTVQSNGANWIVVGQSLDTASLSSRIDTKLNISDTTSKTWDWGDITGKPTIPTFTLSGYTPTITNTTNVAASTAYTTNYSRVGDWVYVWGTVDIDATAATTITEIDMTLPTTTTFANIGDLSGTASFEDNTSVQIKANTTNGKAMWRFTPQSATNNKYSFNFSYYHTTP